MRRPDVFHAGVAGAPVCDWHDYDTHYTERYLGIPPKDAGAYNEGSLLTYAQDLKRPLLILHGTDDLAIPVVEAHRLYDAAHEPKMIFIADGAGHLDAWEGGGERLALEALTRWTTPAELAR